MKWPNKLHIIEFKNLVADGFTKDSYEEFLGLVDVDVVILTSDLVCDPVIGNITNFLGVLDFTLERMKFDNIWGSLFSLLPEVDLEVFKFSSEPWDIFDTDSKDWLLIEKLSLYQCIVFTAIVFELGDVDLESVAWGNALCFVTLSFTLL